MRTFLKILFVVVFTTLVIFVAYFNNTKLCNPTVENYYNDLKKNLINQGYTSNILVISTKRLKIENEVLSIFSVASTNSKHLKSEAIDFLVFDINSDGKSNYKDVDIVYEILENYVMKNKGGIGVYKGKNGLTKQMVHIDSRETKSRWYY